MHPEHIASANPLYSRSSSVQIRVDLRMHQTECIVCIIIDLTQTYTIYFVQMSLWRPKCPHTPPQLACLACKRWASDESLVSFLSLWIESYLLMFIQKLYIVPRDKSLGYSRLERRKYQLCSTPFWNSIFPREQDSSWIKDVVYRFNVSSEYRNDKEITLTHSRSEPAFQRITLMSALMITPA